MSQQNLGTYQMLWDCPYCGTSKLLGLDHRHCPSCGAAQDPQKRYFPSDEDKVAVEDHVYTGADKQCPACQTPNAARANNCTNCGSGVAGGGAAPRPAHHHTPRRGGPPAPSPTEKKKGKKGLACCAVVAGVGLVLALVAVLLVVLLWKKDAAVTVASHSWERAIDIETYKEISEEAWCDQKPGDAYDVRTSREVRDHKKIPDGEDCYTRQVDNGDGTFSEVQDCETRYREEPIYDDWCDYHVKRWVVGHTVTEEGSSLGDSPEWPAVKLKKKGTSLGAEREGKRRETYTVHYGTADGGSYTCDFDQSTWASYEMGASYTGKVGVITHALDCDSLIAQ